MDMHSKKFEYLLNYLNVLFQKLNSLKFIATFSYKEFQEWYIVN